MHAHCLDCCYSLSFNAAAGWWICNYIHKRLSPVCKRLHCYYSNYQRCHLAFPALLLFHAHTFNDPLSGTIWVSRYQKGKTNLDFTEARDSEWQWHQLGQMQVCTSLQTDNHASTQPLSFLQAGYPSCHPTNSVKAMKAHVINSLLSQKCLNIDVTKHSQRETNTQAEKAAKKCEHYNYNIYILRD